MVLDVSTKNATFTSWRSRVLQRMRVGIPVEFHFWHRVVIHTFCRKILNSPVKTIVPYCHVLAPESKESKSCCHFGALGLL